MEMTDDSGWAGIALLAVIALIVALLAVRRARRGQMSLAAGEMKAAAFLMLIAIGAVPLLLAWDVASGLGFPWDLLVFPIYLVAYWGPVWLGTRIFWRGDTARKWLKHFQGAPEKPCPRCGDGMIKNSAGLWVCGDCRIRAD